MHSFDFKCQSIATADVGSNEAKYIKKTVIKTVLKTALKHVTVKLISCWQRLRGSRVGPESGPLDMGDAAPEN